MSDEKMEHSPLPWEWVVEDYSMATLGHGQDPGLGDPHVLSVSPCKSCAERAKKRAECAGQQPEWEWGLCLTPSHADAQFIVTACNSYYENKAAIAELVEALKMTANALSNHVDLNEKFRSPFGSDLFAYDNARALIAKHKSGE